jgi:hypothetical protein
MKEPRLVTRQEVTPTLKVLQEGLRHSDSGFLHGIVELLENSPSMVDN